MTTATTTILSHVRRERAYPKTVKTKHLRSEKNLRDAFPENAFRYYCLTCFRRRTFRRETYGSAKNRDEDVYFHFRERISDVYHVTSETDLRDAVHIQQTQQTYTVYDSLRTIRRGDGLCILGCTRCVASVGLRIIHSVSKASGFFTSNSPSSPSSPFSHLADIGTACSWADSWDLLADLCPILILTIINLTLTCSPN